MSSQIIAKSGYRQTEIGEIPDDWDLIDLGDICKLINDGTHFTPKYVPKGIPFYSVESITDDNFTDVKFISEQEHKILIKRCRPEQNDILLTRIGTVGETKLIDWQVNASIYVSLALLKIDEQKIIIEYLYSYTKSNSFKHSIKKRSLTNATPQKINMGDIEKIPIPLPKHKSEQMAISKTIFDFMKLVKQLDYLIRKKKNIKQGTIQELLTGKKRLEGFTDPWKLEKIKNISQIIRGASPRPKGDKRYYGGNIPRLMVKDVTRDGKFVTPNIDFLTIEGEKLSRPCKKGTLTVVCSGTVGIPSFLAVDACIHDGFLALVDIQKNISSDFLYHQLSNLRNMFESSATHGGVFTNLTTTILEEFLIRCPSTKEEQLAIAQILSDMDLEIKELETKRNKYIRIKNGMMQKLFTGEIRLT